MNHDYFEAIDTEEKSYWLGFLFADGNVSQPTSGRFTVTLSQKEADIPASFLTALSSTNKVNVNRKGPYVTHRASVSSSKMVSDLGKYGCGPAKSLTLGPPLIDLGDYTRDFIRGYNDGDGGFYLKPPRMKTRGTAAFLYWMQGKLPVGSLMYPNGPTAQLFICKRRVLCDTIEYLYEGATVFLERKHAVAMQLANGIL